MSSQNEDRVILDGMYPGRDWPLELAEELLEDPTPWSKGYHDSGPTQWSKFAKVAGSVNWHSRMLVSPKLAADRLRANEPLESYSTQELLDMLSALWRMQHHVGSGLTQIEPRMRELLRIVVTRVKSSTPPQFEQPT